MHRSAILSDTFADTNKKGPNTRERIGAYKLLLAKAEGGGLEPPSACARRISSAVPYARKSRILHNSQLVSAFRTAECGRRFVGGAEQPDLTLLLTPGQHPASPKSPLYIPFRAA